MAQKSSFLKKLIIAFCLLVALGIVGLVVLSMYLGPILKKGVNTIGPKITGTRVELASASVSPFAGGATLKGLFVGNPSGWKSDKAFYLGEIKVKLKSMSLLGDAIDVEEISIKEPHFVFEKGLTSSNINDLLKQIDANMGGGKTAQSKPNEPASDKTSAQKIIVRKFQLSDAQVTLGLGAMASTIPMPAITMTDIGVAEGGVTADQLATVILKRVLADVTAAGVKGAASALQGAGQGAGGAAGAVKDAAKGAGDAVKGLFKSNQDK
ncbi:hypothetical protein [Geminisphaera colitermitum]|uniref:hypothetical protein n=1 Tax=Geminisphaera colitermitum TaxID=1148786 RepID=UPI0001965018|nr:hypothetical protein [Geminisphaera colitermitum]